MSKKIKPNPEHLRFAVIAVDAVTFAYINNQIHILLGAVSPDNPFKGKKAHIGGLVFPEETTDQSVKRLLKDKAGIGSQFYIEQLYTFSEIDRDPRGRVVSVAHMALVAPDVPQQAKGEIETQWVPVSHIPKLAYDHNKVLKVAIERLQSKFAYTNVAQFLLPKEFTMTDLQDLYEAVLGKELDKRNFRKKILMTDMIKETGEKIKRGVMRPAAAYTFSTKTQREFLVL